MIFVILCFELLFNKSVYHGLILLKVYLNKILLLYYDTCLHHCTSQNVTINVNTSEISLCQSIYLSLDLASRYILFGSLKFLYEKIPRKPQISLCH